MGGKSKPWQRVHRMFQIACLIWTVASLGYLINMVRTQGLPDGTLRSTQTVLVEEAEPGLSPVPRQATRERALIFLSGSGIHPRAYTALLKPIAEAGFAVHIIALPYRFAPLESHKLEAMQRVSHTVKSQSHVDHWVIAGHSLGAALAARFAKRNPDVDAHYVLIATTHPKRDTLAMLTASFTKIYASEDGVAPRQRVAENRHLLPDHTQYIRIDGGNHSQFGHYGHQLFDGAATIDRATQHRMTQHALLSILNDH